MSSPARPTPSSITCEHASQTTPSSAPSRTIACASTLDNNGSRNAADNQPGTTSTVAAAKQLGKTTLIAFAAGAVSASCTTICFQPLDLVKTRMQARALFPAPVGAGSSVCLSAGMFSTFNTVVQRENFIALWKGTSPSLQRCVPSIGVYFATIHFLKSSLGKADGNIGPLQALAIGASARAFAASTFLPITVVKTRFESGHFNYRGVPQALRSIWYTEGSKGLFSGLWATLARDVPFSALYLTFYTQSKQIASSALQREHLAPIHNLTCGVMAGVLASLITQPADVVKTRMQINPHQYPTLLSTLAYTLRERGPQGLFTGSMPRAARRTFMAAFTWLFYEEISQFIHRGLNGRLY